MEFLLLIVVAAIVIIALWVVMMYNTLIAGKNRVKEAWSDIDVQLKRRYDLIPNLVETVKGYATHEKELLENVTKARNMAMSAQGVAAKGQAENMLSETLKSLFAVTENYPDLKATQNFIRLHDELADTENKIQASRRFYNGNTRDFNIKLEQFPSNVIGNMFGFTKFEFFEITEAKERENVKVAFGQ